MAMARVKHSKFKNIGILYELLARQLTSDVLRDKKDGVAVDILKEYFGKDTEISKELELYNILQNKKTNNSKKAEDLLEIVIDARKKLSNAKLRKETYNLVKEIKTVFDATDFFKTRLPNYRFYASVYNLFADAGTGKELNPVTKVNSKYTILENISYKKVKEEEVDNEVFKEFKESDADVRLLTYKRLIDKFNTKYSTLTTEQKSILKKYIYNVSNNTELKEFVAKQLESIKTVLKKYRPKIRDEVTSIKLKGAITKIDEIKQKKHVDEVTLTSVLRYYDLVNELKEIK
jgi:hypothetical protein